MVMSICLSVLRELHWLPFQHRIMYTMCWPSRVQQRHSTDIPQSSHQSFCRWTDTLLVCRPSAGQPVRQDTSRDKPFVVPCHLSGTRCLRQYSALTHCLYLNLGLRRTSSVRLLINTHDWRASSTSEAKALALYKSEYYYYYHHLFIFHLSVTWNTAVTGVDWWRIAAH